MASLEDIDGHNGPLVYYPGSQKLPEITFKDIGVRPCQSNYAKYEEFMEHLVGNKTGKTPGEPELPPKLGLIRKGQALIWSANLIHGGAPQKDKTRTRHSLVTHFTFEGCSYFSPMHGNERFTFRKHPTWIALRREAAAGSWDALLSGRADLVIGAPAAGPPGGGYETAPLHLIKFVLAVSPRHRPAACEGVIADSELAQYRAVLVGDTTRALPLLQYGLLQNRSFLSVPDTDAKLQAILLGIGCGFLPERLARSQVRAGRLKVLRVETPLPPGQSTLAWRAGENGRAPRWWVDQLSRPQMARKLYF